MDVFEFREYLVGEYEKFTRSFTRVGAEDIRSYIDRQYGSQRYWPEPLIQINPNFEFGGTVEDLVRDGQLSPPCARIFRLNKSASSAGISLPLHKHQAQAISLAAAGQSYVLTTGTGSGKSLSYFIPIVDACLKAKAIDPSPRTRAIVIYPMNALANSQLEELKKFLGTDPAQRPVSFGRYTGQESDEERAAISSNPPDILLTNFMMLELLMTRQSDIDKAVMRHARGLRFLVLDELHTYRGRQGADVALLVRRVREALAEKLVCIGTSATMATEGTPAERNAVVAQVASRLFGVPIPERNVITETLRRTTPEHETLETIRPRLSAAIRSGVPKGLDYATMAAHPVAVWVELTLGLAYEGDKPCRARPRQLAKAAEALAHDSGESFEACLKYLQDFLLLAHSVRDESGKSLFAFKLHQFIAGGGKVYATLEAPGERAI
ncbi:MAG: DEAD/DEAH box helicase, partial [Casimicrobiaceae bacterium]